MLNWQERGGVRMQHQETATGGDRSQEATGGRGRQEATGGRGVGRGRQEERKRRWPHGLDSALYILVFLCRMPSRVFALGKYSVTASILVHVLPKSAKLDRTLM